MLTTLHMVYRSVESQPLSRILDTLALKYLLLSQIVKCTAGLEDFDYFIYIGIYFYYLLLICYSFVYIDTQ